ncbi:MAG: peptidyl-prolyl cis-trans isomerase [Rhodocyclaceae bacterium]|jgi:cyclophilin family peptidyl-prolyl cis-trans isomerase|nr:MAG: peptidyl-prolyl cis-trans isomerase [Rhodocyclaceae bacterium]
MFKKISLLVAALSLSVAAWAGPKVEMQTSLGRIVIELDDAKAPGSTKNFLAYVQDGFYNGTVFHRVIPNFMIQGGGFTADLTQKPTKAPIQNEAKNGLKNARGTIAMARTQDPHSATAQFFINHIDNVMLDYPSRDGWGYAVFGKVTEGMDVVDKIAQVRAGNRGMHQNVPVEPVVIQSVKVISEK